jgi:hypothetical protein
MATVMDGIQQAPQAPQAAQRPRGLLGGFFGPEGRDARSRLAIGLEGLAMNPNQALIGQLQQGIESRATTAQRNKTVDWLRSRGHDDLAAALETGSIEAGSAVNEALSRERPADPMDALNLQIKQLELQNLQNPQPGFRRATPQEAAAYGAQAGQFGPDGRFYAEEVAQPEEVYRQVTGAQIGMTGPDAQKLFNVAPSGQITAVGGTGTTVNVDTGSGGKFEEAFAKGDAATIETVYNAGLQAARNIGRINQLETLLAAAPSGAEGALKMAAGEFGINTEGLSDAQAAQSMINSLVPEQRQPGSGPMSDADLNLFKQSLPRIINQPGGNQIIVGTMRAIAQYDAEGAAIVQKLRAGEFGTGDSARAKAFQMLQDRQNPLASFKAPPATAGGGGATGGGAGATIRYDENGNRMP